MPFHQYFPLRAAMAAAIGLQRAQNRGPFDFRAGTMRSWQKKHSSLGNFSFRVGMTFALGRVCVFLGVIAI
jgi:hypothetical protein